MVRAAFSFSFSSHWVFAILAITTTFQHIAPFCEADSLVPLKTACIKSHYYALYTQPLSGWYGAVVTVKTLDLQCGSTAPHMATITSQAEQTAIVQQLLNGTYSDKVWIGLLVFFFFFF